MSATPATSRAFSRCTCSTDRRLTRLQDAAAKGDLSIFLREMQTHHCEASDTCWILKHTLKLFRETMVGLFDAYESDELAASYREAKAIREGKPLDYLACAAATPPVQEWAEGVSDPIAKSTVFISLYKMKCMLRIDSTKKESIKEVKF